MLQYFLKVLFRLHTYFLNRERQTDHASFANDRYRSNFMHNCFYAQAIIYCLIVRRETYDGLVTSALGAL